MQWMIFCDMKGVLLVGFHGHGKTVNAASYSSLPKCLKTDTSAKAWSDKESICRCHMTTHCMSDLGRCRQTGLRSLLATLYLQPRLGTQWLPSFRANETNARRAEVCLGCWSAVNCSLVAQKPARVVLCSRRKETHWQMGQMFKCTWWI